MNIKTYVLLLSLGKSQDIKNSVPKIGIKTHISYYKITVIKKKSERSHSCFHPLCPLCMNSGYERNSSIIEFVVVQSLSCVWFSVTPRTTTRQASLSITNSWSSLKLMSIALVMPSNHLILCRPLLLLSVFPSIRVFSNESALCIRWPKYWSFSFSISPSNEY